MSTEEALLPDFDHPSTTTAQSAGEISWDLSSALTCGYGLGGATYSTLTIVVLTRLAQAS